MKAKLRNPTYRKMTHSKKLQDGKKRFGNSTFYLEHCDDDDDTILSQLEELRFANKKLREMLVVEKEKRKKEEAKNTDLLLRLSKVAGERLVNNNPAIADLSDRNRPTKLGEVYSELYDNEWTDALQGLQDEGYGEEYAISTLLLTFINIFDFCKQKRDRMLVKTEDAVSFLFEDYKVICETKEQARFMTMPRRRCSLLKCAERFTDIELNMRWMKKSNREYFRQSVEIPLENSDTIETKIKALRKETAELMVPAVQKAYLKATWRNGEFVPSLKPFIRKCIFVCWMMVVQSPPMCVLEVEMKENLKFDKNCFREYTASGPMVKYFVWPALLLYENGPVVCKGIAQGC